MGKWEGNKSVEGNGIDVTSTDPEKSMQKLQLPFFVAKESQSPLKPTQQTQSKTPQVFSQRHHVFNFMNENEKRGKAHFCF